MVVCKVNLVMFVQGIKRNFWYIQSQEHNAHPLSGVTEAAGNAATCSEKKIANFSICLGTDKRKFQHKLCLYLNSFHFISHL